MSDSLSNLSKVGAIGRQPLSERVYETLKSAIINGDIAFETKLAETDIAERMGVSATPVREAFRRLAAEGLVVITPWKGVTVRGYTEQEMVEMYQCREVLEGLASRLAAINIDSKGIRSLRQLAEKAKSVALYSEVVRLNTELHNIILQYACNSKLKAMLEVFSDLIIRDRNLTAYNAQRRQEIEAEHQAIITALAERDPDKAEYAMRLHVRNGFAYKQCHK